jgi:hypothetical protein
MLGFDDTCRAKGSFLFLDMWVRIKTRVTKTMTPAAAKKNEFPGISHGLQAREWDLSRVVVVVWMEPVRGGGGVFKGVRTGRRRSKSGSAFEKTLGGLRGVSACGQRRPSFFVMPGLLHHRSSHFGVVAGGRQ